MKKLVKMLMPLLPVLFLDVNNLYSQDSALKCKFVFTASSNYFIAEHIDGVLTYSDVNSTPIRFGLLDMAGNITVSPRWETYKYADGMLITTTNERQGLFSTNGRTILPEIYDNIKPLTNGYFLVKKDSDYGMADKEGNFTFPLGTISIADVERYSGYILAYGKGDNKDYYFDTEGNKSTFSDYYEAKKKGVGYSMAKIDDKYFYGLEKGDGTVVLPPKYDEIYEFHDGLAVVKKEGKFGYIDKEGKEVIRPKYSAAGDCSCNYVVVIDDVGKSHVFDRSGNIVAEDNDNYTIRGQQFINGVILVATPLSGSARYGYLYIPQMASVSNEVAALENYGGAINTNTNTNTNTYIIINNPPVNNTYQNTYTQPQKQICYNCNGTGRVDKIGYAPTYGSTAQVWCKICGRYVAAGHYHYQERCRICNGTGYR